MAYGYQDQIPQQEMIGVGDIAGAMINPVNWYKYNPSMWSVTRGQIKVPLVSGRNIRRVSNFVRKWGGSIGNSTVDFIRDKSGLKELGGVMKSESIWVGSAPMSSENVFATTTKFGPLREQRLAAVVAEKSRRANIAAFDDVFSPTTPRQFPGPYTPPESVVARAKFGADRIQYVNENVSALKRQGYKVTDELYDRSRRFGRELTRNIKGTYTRISGFGKVGMKLGMRAGVAIGKGFAYYQIASLMYSTAQMAFEPLGRKAISTIDSIFNAKTQIGVPELGGNLPMQYLTRGAATERQRALQAIQKSRLNARQAMGNEGQLYHQ